MTERSRSNLSQREWADGASPREVRLKVARERCVRNGSAARNMQRKKTVIFFERYSLFREYNSGGTAPWRPDVLCTLGLFLLQIKFNLDILRSKIHYFGWVQYCSNTKTDSRLKLKHNSDSSHSEERFAPNWL